MTGGAGYIGSHMALQLREAGAHVTVFDNLSTGHRDAAGGCELIEGDLRDLTSISRVLSKGSFDVVMHFAASCYVGESMAAPEKYFLNNVVGSANLLAAMRSAGLTRLVFSSTCATYGEPRQVPIDEGHPQEPVNPYGLSKLTAEKMMREYARAYGFGVVSLRYFNAAGCDPAGRLGERHDPETHLIPLALMEAARVSRGGKPGETALQLFGTDFDTPDGSCVRDYVHVNDLCDAHRAAMQRLLGSAGGAFEAFNLGTGSGSSVKQVIEACRRATGIDIRYRNAGRRPGDPARLVADAKLARSALAWQPKFSLDDIVATAWRWFARPAAKASG